MKFLRIFFLFLILPVCFLGLGAFWALNSTDIFEVVIPLRLNPLLKGTRILEMNIERQSFIWPGRFEFEDVSVTFWEGGERRPFALRKLQIDGIDRLFSSGPIEAKLTGLNLQTSVFKVNEVDGAVTLSLNKDHSLHSIAGELTAASVDYQTLLVEYLRSDIAGDDRRIHFKDFLANFNGGVVRGEILLDYAPKLSYSIKLNFNDVDLSRLEKTHSAIFSYVQGVVEGDIQIEGDAGSFSSIIGRFDTSGGGQIKAFLLKHLLEYLPAHSAERSRLETIIRQGGYVKLEVADGQINSADEEHLNIRLHLFSQAHNLDITYPVDVYVEGGIIHMFDFLHTIANEETQ